LSIAGRWPWFWVGGWLAGDIPRRNVKRFRGGLIFKAHRLLYHSTQGLREIKMRRRRVTYHGRAIGLVLHFDKAGRKLPDLPHLQHCLLPPRPGHIDVRPSRFSTVT